MIQWSCLWERVRHPNIHWNTRSICKKSRFQERSSEKFGKVYSNRQSRRGRCRTDFSDFITRPHVESRVQLYVSKEEAFPILLKYMTESANLNVLQGKRIDDYWNVDVDRSLSDSWIGFTKFTLKNQKSHEGFINLVSDIKKSSNYEIWSFMVWNIISHIWSYSTKRRVTMIYRQTKLDNTRKFKDIYFFDPDDGEFKEILTTCWKS